MKYHIGGFLITADVLRDTYNLSPEFNEDFGSSNSDVDMSINSGFGSVTDVGGLEPIYCLPGLPSEKPARVRYRIAAKSHVFINRLLIALGWVTIAATARRFNFDTITCLKRNVLLF